MQTFCPTSLHIIKPPTPRLDLGSSEGRRPTSSKPTSTLEGEGYFKTSSVKCSPWRSSKYPDALGKGLEMWATGQAEPCFAVKLDYSCFSLLVLLDLLHWVGIFKHLKWDFLFCLPGGEKSPFGMVPSAVAWAVRRLASGSKIIASRVQKASGLMRTQSLGRRAAP